MTNLKIGQELEQAKKNNRNHHLIPFVINFEFKNNNALHPSAEGNAVTPVCLQHPLLLRPACTQHMNRPRRSVRQPW
jgi:hypothetical protein